MSVSVQQQVLAFVQENQLSCLTAVVAVLLVPVLYALLNPPADPPFLDPKAEYRPLTLARKTQVTHNTVRLEFVLPGEGLGQ
jgi:hypothetical protein